MSALSAPAVRRAPDARRAAVDDDYIEFCNCIRELTGLDLGHYKRAQMERRLRSFFAARQIDSLHDAARQLRADPATLDAVLDRITINVSQLWRNPEQWELIEREVLPTLLRSSHGRVLRAWSAGCSYGAEAYTLAAICHNLRAERRITIEGTDIDKRMIERARLGVFSEADARSAPAGALETGFEHTADGWRARIELRAFTRFDTGDLLRMPIPIESFDLILCRNTVIYFDEPVRDDLHARMAAGLRPGGYLVIGSTERVNDAAAAGLKPQHPFIYRKA